MDPDRADHLKTVIDQIAFLDSVEWEGGKCPFCGGVQPGSLRAMHANARVQGHQKPCALSIRRDALYIKWSELEPAPQAPPDEISVLYIE